MKHLRTTWHSDISDKNGSRLRRLAARGIIFDSEPNSKLILLMYTERYHDYSLPGGGVDDSEDVQTGLIREIEEETGAQQVEVLSDYGIYEEYRPWHKPEHDILHMVSHCYLCRVAAVLGETRHEVHEIANGMKPVWIDIREAIAHNREIIASSTKKGMSIERETWLLEQIASNWPVSS